MIRQLKYEAYRFFKSKKNRIVFSLLIVLLISINYVNYQNHRSYHRETLRWHHAKASMADSWFGFLIKFGSEQMDSLGLDAKQLETQIDYYKTEAQMLYTLHMYYNGNNPAHHPAIFQTEIQRYNKIIDALDQGELPPESIIDRGMTYQLMQNEIMLREYVLNQKIDPMINPYTLTASNAMVQFLQGDYLLVLLILITLLTMDIYLSEMEEGSYKITYVTPLNRTKILSAKLIVSTAMSLILLLVIAFLYYWIARLIHGPGDWTYPMVTQTTITSLLPISSQSNPMIISTGAYVALGFLSLMAVTFFIVAMVMFISVLTDSSKTTLGLMTLLLVTTFITGNFVSPDLLIHRIFPLSYVYVNHVIPMTHSSMYMLGLFINGIGGLMIIGLTFWKYQQKDFLGTKH